MGESLYRAAGFGAMIAVVGGLTAGCTNPGKPAPVPDGSVPSAAPDSPGNATPREPATPAGRLRVLEEHPASAPVSVQTILGDAAPRLSYIEIDPASQARATVERTGTSPRLTAARREIARPGEPQKTLSEEHLIIRDDGSLAVEDEVVRDEGVHVVYDPPMVLLPASLLPGTPQTQKLNMVVHPLGDEHRIKSKGPVESTVSLVGSAVIQTPAGRLETAHIRHVFVAHLSAAVVTNSTDRWYAPGIGLVCERRAERTTLAGVPIRSSKADWVLESLPDR